jgi:hypothetical protein
MFQFKNISIQMKKGIYLKGKECEMKYVNSEIAEINRLKQNNASTDSLNLKINFVVLLFKVMDKVIL